MRPLRVLARFVQRRRVRECERNGGSFGYGGTFGVCLFPEDHYPDWVIKVRLS